MDEQSGEIVKWGPFELGRSYDEVGPELGRFYEARHARTGRAALTFMLSEQVEWQPSGEWEVRVRFGPKWPSVTLRVDRAPRAARPTELTDAFVQVTAALTRTEDSAQMQEHLARGTVRPWRRWALWALEGASVLALGLGLWMRHEAGAPKQAPLLHRAQDGTEAWPTDATHGDSMSTQSGEAPRAVKNQKPAPCAEGLEVEVSGVCWVPVEQRPCPKQTHAYAGQCLLPVAKPQPVPQSFDAGPLERR